MKLRLAKKIWNKYNTERAYNKFMFDKSFSRVLKYYKFHKTPKWLLRKREQSKYRDKFLSCNNSLGEELREYINNKQLKRKRHERRK